MPRQLKPAPAHFTARAAELAELERISGPDRERRGPVVAVISGQGGVGKSALALRWLHDVAHRFPDGQLYADLTSDIDSAPALMTSVLGRFLRAFGMSGERIPVDVGEAAALFRSLTAGKRVAMLVDNPTSAAQVRVLLPASPLSVVVVASRWRLGGLAMDGAGFLPLVPLQRTAGTEMLARTVGETRVAREPEEVANLVELCGGLPIALSIAGARLTTRPTWPVARVVQELTDEQRRLSALSMERDVSVTSVFDLSYHGLSAREAMTYRRLGLHPGPFLTVAAAAAVLDTSADDAMDLLDTLVNASLLDVTGDNAYRFHDLVRLHARERAVREDTEADRNALLARTLRYYLRFAATADRVVSPLDLRVGPVFREPANAEAVYPNAEAALGGMEEELPNLLAVLRAGADLGLDDLVWQTGEAMWSLFLRRKHFPDWIATYELGIVAAMNCGNDAALSRMHDRLGIAFHNLDRADDAVAEGMAAVAAARAAGDIGTEAEALQLVGMANRSRGRFDEAIAALRESIVLVSGTLPRTEALSRRLLGQALIAVDRPAEAVEELRRASAMADELADDHVVANINVWLADALARAGQGPEAIELLKDTWPTIRESGSSQHQAQLFMVWGWTAERLDDLVSAKDLFDRALTLYTEIGAPHTRQVRTDLDRVEARITALAADG